MTSPLGLDIDMGKKDYLKIFFEAEREEYQREGKRYFIPNIYNSNQYNITVNDETLGLPDNNQGMNAKIFIGCNIFLLHIHIDVILSRHCKIH